MISVLCLLAAGGLTLYLLNVRANRAELTEAADAIEAEAAAWDTDVLEYTEMLLDLGTVSDQVYFELERRHERREKQ